MRTERAQGTMEARRAAMMAAGAGAGRGRRLRAMVLWALLMMGGPGLASHGALAREWGEPVHPYRSRAHVSGFAGNFSGQDNPGQLESGHEQFTLGMSFGYRKNRFLILEGDILLLNRTYSALPQPSFFLVGFSDEMTVESKALTFTAKGVMPLRRLEPFLGAGVGMYVSEATVSGTAFLIPIEESEKEIDFGFHIVAGVDVILGESWNLGLEFRKYFLESDFGDLSGGKVDIGGVSTALVARFFL